MLATYEPEQKVNKEEILGLYQKGLSGEEIARTLRVPWAKIWPVIRRLKKKDEL